MPTKLSRGKFENLQKLADDEGTLTILGLDQRKSFQKLMAQSQEQSGHQFNENNVMNSNNYFLNTFLLTPQEFYWIKNSDPKP